MTRIYPIMTYAQGICSELLNKHILSNYNSIKSITNYLKFPLFELFGEFGKLKDRKLFLYVI
jgi:hypothetical protein